MSYCDTDEDCIRKNKPFELWLRVICTVGLILLAATMALGLSNAWRLCRRQSSDARALIPLFYAFSLLAMLSSSVSLVWYVVDPSLYRQVGDEADGKAGPPAQELVQAVLAPAYWGLFATVLLSMHELGITL